MQSNQNSNYNNESITSLKGADRVRLRPGVISGLMGWKAANMPSSKSSPTPSTKQEKVLAAKSKWFATKTSLF